MTELEQALSNALKAQSEQHNMQQRALLTMQKELLAAFESVSAENKAIKNQITNYATLVDSLHREIMSLKQQASFIESLLKG